jgi:hypothetical protein
MDWQELDILFHEIGVIDVDRGSGEKGHEYLYECQRCFSAVIYTSLERHYYVCVKEK